jgi:hypothetical protein
MITFAFETKLQHLGLNLENAEFLAPLFSFQHLGLSFRRGKCELRDVIHTPAMIKVSLHYSSLVKLCTIFSHYQIHI